MSMHLTRLAVAFALVLGAMPMAFSQDKPADNLQIAGEKIRADKKRVVAANMDLTESEATRFWPVYDAYQSDLHKINERLLELIASYARDYRNNSLTDERAAALVDEKIASDEAEVALQKQYVPLLKEAVPAKKVARYLQIETRFRAGVRATLADNIPMVE